MAKKKRNNQNSPYNPEFVAEVKKAQKEIDEGKGIEITDVDQFFANLDNEPITVNEVTREDLDRIRELSHQRVAEKLKDAEIVAAVTERFMQNHKGDGELTDNELFILNSQINFSRYLADKL